MGFSCASAMDRDTSNPTLESSFIMSARKGQLWKWRRRVAYRLLATPNKTDTDDDLAPVRLDFPGTDIWLRATSMPERRWRAKSCAKEPFTVQWLEDYVRKGDVLYDRSEERRVGKKGRVRG